MDENKTYLKDLEKLAARKTDETSGKSDPTIIDGGAAEFRQLLELNDRLMQIIQKKDIELAEVRSQLVHAGKLATLGTIGVGVAHELNNPLTVVSAEADEILDAMENGYFDEQLLATSTQNIKKSADRMRRIIDYMRQHGRQEARSDWKKLDINEQVNRALILLKPQLENSGIQIRLNLATDLPEIWGDSTKLESVFQNLIGNAKDAFESIADGRQKRLTISTNSDASNVVIKIKDNACGMPEEVRTRLFDPFFTTKSKGKGTGVGLSIARRFLKDHKAAVSLESHVGKGTEFTLQFPLDRRSRGHESRRIREEQAGGRRP